VLSSVSSCAFDLWSLLRVARTWSARLLYLRLSESALGPMAAMGYCIHLCVAGIICGLVLVGIYLDVLKMIDSNDSGNLFNDWKHIPSKTHHIWENRTAPRKPSVVFSIRSSARLSVPKKGSSFGSRVRLPCGSWHTSTLLPAWISHLSLMLLRLLLKMHLVHWSVRAVCLDRR